MEQAWLTAQSRWKELKRVKERTKTVGSVVPDETAWILWRGCGHTRDGMVTVAITLSSKGYYVVAGRTSKHSPQSICGRVWERKATIEKRSLRWRQDREKQRETSNGSIEAWEEWSARQERPAGFSRNSAAPLGKRTGKGPRAVLGAVLLSSESLLFRITSPDWRIIFPY